MWIRTAALLLTTLTGFTGLVYEVTWQKYLALLLGSQSEATAAILAIFLGGLALGYGLFGRLAHRISERTPAEACGGRLLVIYGGVEMAIGGWALAFPVFFEAARIVSIRGPLGHAGAGFAFDVALSALLIGPASILMGATIPMLTQALSRGIDDATRLHALVYGTNTAGAIAGALGAAFWLLPRLGLTGTLSAMAAANLIAGTVLALLGWRFASGLAEGSAATPSHTGAGDASVTAYAGVALLTGFGMMTLQTVLIRMAGLSLGASHFTFAMIVAAFVACIAVGSFVVSSIRQLPPALVVANQCAVPALLALLYGPLQNGPYYAHVVRVGFGTTSAEMIPYFATVLGWCLVVFGPPIVLSGAVLPLLFHHLRSTVGELGAVAGRLYAWNTAGSLIGALLGGYLLFLIFDLHHVYRIAVASLVAAAGLLAATVFPQRRALAAGACGIAIFTLGVLPQWDEARLASGLFRLRAAVPGAYRGPDAFFERIQQAMQSEILFYDDDPTTSVAAARHRVGEGRTSLAILMNGKPDSSIVPDYSTGALIGMIPALHAERVERAFVLGFGVGITAGELAALESTRVVDVAEISRGVIEAAPIFDGGNLGASRNPKVELIRTDAYRALLRSPGDYDVIVSQPSNPWVSGIEILFSQEFLEAVRKRLRPGGVYGQWIHTYETDDATVELVVRTFASVFPNHSIWFTDSHDILLVGLTAAPAEDRLERVLRRAARPDIAAALSRAGVADVPALLAHEIVPPGASRPSPGPLHTARRPRLGDLAARAFFRGDTGDVPRSLDAEARASGRQNSLVVGFTRREGGLSEAARTTLVAETCEARPRECLTLLAQWRADAPEAEALHRELARAATRMGAGPDTLLRRIDELVPLFERGPQPEEQALYRRFYHHAAPFAG